MHASFLRAEEILNMQSNTPSSDFPASTDTTLIMFLRLSWTGGGGGVVILKCDKSSI